MAQLIRSAKSGSDWTSDDLDAYNIHIKLILPSNFFPNEGPSLEHFDPAILTLPATATKKDHPNVSQKALDYLGYLDLTTDTREESAMDNFGVETLKLLDFPPDDAIVFARKIIPLTICGEWRVAQTDVCIIQRPERILLNLIEDKTTHTKNPKVDTEAQMVAEAIAAFQFNNTQRRRAGESSLEAMTITCITMYGMMPSFYLVPVTKQLNDAIISGEYPQTPTQVLCCSTATDQRWSSGIGMADVELRKLALQRLLAFRDLAQTYWQKYVV